MTTVPVETNERESGDGIVGARLPGGEYVVDSACNERVLAATSAATGLFPGAHPIFASVATLTSMGIGIEELCRRAGASIDDGPMLGEFKVTFSKPLALDTPYRITGRIESVTRKRSERLGAMDLLELAAEMTGPSGETAAQVSCTWVLPRRSGG